MSALFEANPASGAVSALSHGVPMDCEPVGLDVNVSRTVARIPRVMIGP